MHNVPEPWSFDNRMHNENTMHVMSFLITHNGDASVIYLIERRHQSNKLNPRQSNKMMRNGSGEMTATDQYKTSHMTTDEMTMIEIVMKGAENTSAIGMIAITPPTITDGGMTNEGSMQTSKDVGTTGAIITEEISRETEIID